MEESKGLITEFNRIMEDFCVPFDISLIEDFVSLDFSDKYAVENFLDRLTIKKKNLKDKIELADSASKLAREIRFFVRLDDPLDDIAPFEQLHVMETYSFTEIKEHYDIITNGMREHLKDYPLDIGVERDLLLCEKAFKRVKEIRGIK